MRNRKILHVNVKTTITKNISTQEHTAQPIDLSDAALLMTKNEALHFKLIAQLASVNRHYHGLFQPEVEKKIVKTAAEWAIFPAGKNIIKLASLLEARPKILLNTATIKNRHHVQIKGTLYQIALHEGDDELIDDVITPAFKRLPNGLEIMAAQREKWLYEGWMEAEENSCAEALACIDNVFTAFKQASDPNEVTQLSQHPYTITINHESVNKALEAFRAAINALYAPTDQVISSGRDPSIRLLQRTIDRYLENYTELAGMNAAHNNAVLILTYGYAQRFAPINFMQAFAQGIYYIVKEKKKLSRTLNLNGNFILPLDATPHFRLGFECFVGLSGWEFDSARFIGKFLQAFYQSKAALTQQAPDMPKNQCAIM